MNQDVKAAVVADAMDASPPVVEGNMAVEALARRMAADRVEAYCVVEKGRLRGVVTAADVIYRQRPLHQPAYLTFLDAVVPLQSSARMMAELQKAFGESVADVMTKAPLHVSPTSPLGKAVAQMVDGRLSIMPVVLEGRLVGALTRRSLIEHMLLHVDRVES